MDIEAKNTKTGDLTFSCLFYLLFKRSVTLSKPFLLSDVNLYYRDIKTAYTGEFVACYREFEANYFILPRILSNRSAAIALLLLYVLVKFLFNPDNLLSNSLPAYAYFVAYFLI